MMQQTEQVLARIDVALKPSGVTKPNQVID